MKRSWRVEKILGDIKTVFPEAVEIVWEKDRIRFFLPPDDINLDILIKEWTSFFVSIWYGSGDHLRFRFCNVGSIKELREYIEEENK